MTGDPRWYDRWTWAVAVTVLLAGGILPLLGFIGTDTGALITGVAGALALPILFLLGLYGCAGGSNNGDRVRLGHPLPHLFTGTRGLAAVALLFFVSVGVDVADGAGRSLPHATAWILFAILAAVETTDFFDGRVARRLGTSEFGSVWDMENDAFFTFALSYAVWALLAVPGFVLVIGWMRYAYFVVARFQGDPPGHPRAFKLFAKSVAATLVIVLIGVFVPLFPQWFRVLAVSIALFLQLISFGWDFMLHFRARGRVVTG